jgi:hypothetical protein
MMNRKKMTQQMKLMWTLLVCATALVVAAAMSVSAQRGPGGPPPGGGFRGMGPGPGADDALGFVGFEAGFSGKTVTGAPFTADFSTETTDVLSDGNRIDNKTTGTFARDGSGRTRRELTLSSIGGYSTSANGGGPAHGVVINDPVGRVSYVLDANRKQARQMNMPNNPFRGNANGSNRGPNPNAQSNPNVTTQSLGTQMIGGIAAEGTRTTRTIPAGQIGNEKPIELTVERWYSADLQTDVLIKRSDPRGGTTVFQLTNIVRSEPDASLFQVPSDYTVVSGRGPGPRRGMGRPGAPPQPPPQQ